MDSNTPRKWFNNGVNAIACVLTPRPPEGYLCPLCLNFFTIEQLNDGLLTDEHVPPEAVGGKPLVLTCVSCNNTSGGMLDEAVADDEKLRTFGKPHTLGPLPGSVTFEGIANKRLDPLRWRNLPHARRTRPEQPGDARRPHRLLGTSRRRIADGLENPDQGKSEVRRDRLDALRLPSAFAVYGYSYALQPAFEPLRAAIADPGGVDFDAVLLWSPHDAAIDPLIAEVVAPTSLAGCRAVIFGPRLILLPPWLAAGDWFATLGELMTNDAPENLTLGSAIGGRFPKYPMYLTDG